MQSPEKYLGLLRSLADEFPQLKRDKLLFKQMKQSKFLLGTIEITNKKEKHKSQKDDDLDLDDEEDAPIKQYQLAAPDQIVVIDDYISYRLFKKSLMCAPEEEKLEDFYLALGASTLASLVEEQLRLGNPDEKQATAVKIRSHILERSKLFLHQTERSTIKHDSRWLEKNLSVQIVSSISLRRSLRGQNLSHTEKRAAACTHERHKGWTLFVVPGSIDAFQVSQAICKMLLERPTQQSYMSFETFLQLSLRDLQSRGYNVDRILRVKAAEARIAEEERRKQLEAEQQQLKEQQEQWRQENEATPPSKESRRKSKQAAMPGAFGSDSPENSPEPQNQLAPPKPKSRGLFSGLSRRLGLDNSGEAQEQLQNFLGGGSSSHNDHDHDHDRDVDKPPTYDEASKQLGTKTSSGTEKVSSPHAVQQNLLNAIQSSRAHDSSTLFSPPTTQTIKEQASYCDSTPSQNITFLADASNGTRIFVSKTLSIPTTAFLASNSSSLNAFAVLLHEIADVYNLPRKAVHVYFDESGGTIAFNSAGSIFCNFRFWQQLHERKVESEEGRVEAGSYWWIVVAHELAHNLVKEHSAEHSFYT
jgi:hypothetical protein